MSATLERGAELARMLGGDRLARPARPLGEGTNGRRDPSPTWDPWYTLPIPRRRQLLPFMAPAGDRGALTLDQVAALIGAGSLDDALHAWASACNLARSATSWDDLDAGEWAAAEEQATRDAELLGPQELAEHLGISVPALHQRRHRGQLPPADMTISKVPIWTGETIRIWEEWS